jgi:hypothetical protein
MEKEDLEDLEVILKVEDYMKTLSSDSIKDLVIKTNVRIPSHLWDGIDRAKDNGLFVGSKNSFMVMCVTKELKKLNII